MAWIRNHLTVARLCILALLIIALLGPWVYEALSVPDEYTCQPPTLRIRPGFCGDPMSGLFVIGYYGLGFFGVLGSLVSGARTFADAGKELLVALAWLPMLPLLSSVLLIARGRSRSLQVFHWIALGLLTGLMVWFIAAEVPSVVTLHTWGPWLFLAALLAALILELSSLPGRQKAA